MIWHDITIKHISKKSVDHTGCQIVLYVVFIYNKILLTFLLRGGRLVME
jgi:hypothetical protein